MNKNICLVIEGTFPWYIGGVSEWIYQYVKALNDFNFYIIQISTDEFRYSKLNQAVYPIPKNIKKFIRVPISKLENDQFDILSNWAQQVIHDIPDYRNASLIHVTNTGFAGLVGLYIANKTNKPLLLTEHALYWREVEIGTPALECGYKIPDTQKAKTKYSNLFKNIATDLYSKAGKVVSVSQCNLQFQKNLGAKHPIYIPNGVPLSWFDTDVVRKGENDKIIIGWIGRCAGMKDPIRFIDFIEDLTSYTQLNAEYIMMLSDAGEDDLKEDVISRAERVPNLSLIWNKMTRDYIDLFDAVCITSKNESQPLVLFEALARNVLPIGWEVGDVTKEFGFFVDRSVENKIFCNQINDLWLSKEKWYGLLEKLKEYTKMNHNWETVFRQYRDIIKQID